jgi:Multiubiquitin
MDAHTEDVVDVEELAKTGKPIPRASRYRIRVDKTVIVVDGPTITGREILAKAGRVPPEKYHLDQKMRGGSVKQIGLTDVVDLTTPGIERFLTIPLDQTEGDRYGRR